MVDPTTSITARLHLVSGKTPGRAFDLVQDRINIGRDPSNIICLESGTVSLHHALLIRADDRYKVRDLVSTNGTFVNGQRTATAELNNGDLLRFGEIECRYEQLPQPVAQTVPVQKRSLLAFGRQRGVSKRWSKRLTATLLLLIAASAVAAWWWQQKPVVHQAPPNVEPDIHSDPDLAAASAAEDAQNYPEFLARAKRLADRHHDEPLAHFILGVAYADLKFFPDAAAAFQQAIKLKPDYIDAWSNLGWTYAQSGKAPEAVSAFEQLVALTPDDAQAWFSLGDAHTNRGQLENAIAAYREAIDLKLDFADAYLKLGAALAHQGKPAEAMEAFRSALKYKPDLSEAWFNLGVVSEQQQQNSEAVQFFQQAVQLKPDYAEAWGGLVKTYLNLRQADKAAEAAREMKQLDPAKAEQLADELSREAPPATAAPHSE